METGSKMHQKEWYSTGYYSIFRRNGHLVGWLFQPTFLYL